LFADSKELGFGFRSPLGRALCGRRTGDETELQVPSGRRTIEVTSVG
jgi:transcription elongation GreA/GreB family factor